MSLKSGDTFYDIRGALAGACGVIRTGKVRSVSGRWVFTSAGDPFLAGVEGRDLFATPEEATNAADAKRQKKIASLEAQIKKLSTMTLKVEPQP